MDGARGYPIGKPGSDADRCRPQGFEMAV